VPLSASALIDPQIHLTHRSDFTFTLSARGGVAAFAWIDHPSGTVGVFVDSKTGEPNNGFFLIPGQDRTRECLFLLMMI
jgi:beta-mannosidase